MSEKSYVSIEQKVCSICGNTHDSGAILLDKRLKNSMESKTVTGYGHCEDCQAKLDDNYVALVETTTNPGEGKDRLKNEDAVRTGTLIWVKQHVCNQVFDAELKTPMAFVNPEVIKYFKQLYKTTEK